MRSLPAYLRPLWLVLIVALGCSSDPSGPSAASLTVSVLGLPNGGSAAITVTGPGGFSQPVTATQTFTQVARGTYTIAANGVTVGTSDYSPSPQSQTIAVNSSVTATVSYAPVTGNLAITISGLGTASTAAVTVTGPNGFTPRAVGSSTTIAGLNPGIYTVTARDTAPTGGSTHTASPKTQDVPVQARATATAMVTYTPLSNNGSVNLRIAGMYLTQSAQDFAGSIPLVKNRNGLLRVFVIADRANTATPSVQVRVYNGATLQSTIPISPPIGLASVPTAADESSLSFSWNTPLSGTLIQPGLRIEAEVNPAPRVVLETDTTDNILAPSAPIVQKVPRLDVTFVPVIQRGNGLLGRVTAANRDSFLLTTKKMHPIDSVDAVLHAPYTTTTTSTLDANNTNGAWGTILSEIDALRISEPATNSRYYYGIARVTYNSGVAGVAYVSTAQTGARAALGWDYLPTGDVVAAHELGHNWARNHAPCGGPAGLDPNYPRPDGSTGSYGVDVAPQTLEPPTSSDIMGYCANKWISNYTYQGVFNYLLAPSPPFLGSVASRAVQPCLMVWGHIVDGVIVLEPAFEVTTRPSLPARSGPYSLEAMAADGSSLFALSFEPNEVADAQRSQQNFAFAVPLAASRAAQLSRLRVAGRGREAIALSQAAGAPESVVVRRISGDRIALRWNATTHPMVMVRDAETGQVLSFARGGDVELSTTKSQLDLVVSNGVRSHLKRIRVTR